MGLEMADAFTHRGVKVTLFGRSKTVLPTVDQSLGDAVARELETHAVTVHADVEVERHSAQFGRSFQSVRCGRNP